MASWTSTRVRSKTKNTIIRLKKEKGLTEDELIEYALMEAFKKR